MFADDANLFFSMGRRCEKNDLANFVRISAQFHSYLAIVK